MMRTPTNGFTWLLILPIVLRAVRAADNIACYYGTWARYTGLTPSAIPPNLCTSILVAFVQVRFPDLQTIVPFDSGDPVDVYPALIQLRAQSTVGLKIIIALGGATHDNSRIVSLTNNPPLLTTFASNTMSQIRAWGMDGLDVDWEFPANKISHTTFMTAMRTAIDNEVLAPGMSRLELSAALPAGKQFIDPGYDVPVLASLLDIGYVMGYDYHGPWDPFTGHNSPLKPRLSDANQNLNVKWSVEYWNGLGLPKSKLYVGMPTYGRSFRLQTADNGVNAPSAPGIGDTLAYRETCSVFLPDADTVQFWDSESEVPYAARNTDWLSYSNITSIANKCQWVEDNQYAGAMVWSLHQEDYDGICGQGLFPLVTAVRSCNPIVTTQSTTTGSTIMTTAASNFCADKPDSSVHEIPGNCGQFFQCLSGVTFTQTCPAGLHFSNACSCCDFPAGAMRTDCDGTTSTTTTPTPSTESTSIEMTTPSTTPLTSTTSMISSSTSMTPTSTTSMMTSTSMAPTSTTSMMTSSTSMTPTSTTSMMSSSTSMTPTSTTPCTTIPVPPDFCVDMPPFLTLAVPNNCTHFVLCALFGQMFVFPCSNGLWWDPACNCCNFPVDNSRSDCVCMSETTSPTTPPTTTIPIIPTTMAPTSTSPTTTTPTPTTPTAPPTTTIPIIPTTMAPTSTSPTTTTQTPTTPPTTTIPIIPTTMAPTSTSPTTTTPTPTTPPTTTIPIIPTTPPTTTTITTTTTTTPSTTVPTPASTPFQFACFILSDGLHPIPGVCSHYYHCSNGFTFVQPCPATLIFNPDGSLCDRPENVNRTDC